MEGFNDVWANILNGDIINNSVNISEHPSLIVGSKKYEFKEGKWTKNYVQAHQPNLINVDMNAPILNDISGIDASE